MAKLSAYGRTEVLRAVKVYVPEPDSLEDEGIIGRRTEYRLMSDGAMLKCTYWTRLNPFTERHESQSTGWTQYARVRAGLSVAEAADKLAPMYESKGLAVSRAR